MSDFSFISDESLRNSLESDYKELQSCMEFGAWKSVHVLAGSIVEAVLIDYLAAIGYNKAKPLQMTLDQVIKACKDEGVITERTVDLSNVIRSYRNLIHPGRLIRLKDSYDNNTARISEALVHIVLQDVSERKSISYGYKAEQIVKKLELDPSAKAILPHLLSDLNSKEQERLIMRAIPEKYFEIVNRTVCDDNVLRALTACFLETFELVSDDLKRRVMNKFVSIIKEESQYVVEVYQDAFFRADQLKYVEDDSERLMLKQQLLSRLSTKLDASLLDLMNGISGYIDHLDIDMFMEPLIRMYLTSPHDRFRIDNFVLSESLSLEDDLRKAAVKRLDARIRRSKHLGQEENINILQELKLNLTLFDLEDADAI